jgi:hypothetical protein
MNPKWIGDSYDIVKRFFVKALKDLGYSVYIDPMFTGDVTEIREQFLEFIGAQIKQDKPPIAGQTAILVDPDTGISKKRTARHITIKDLVDLMDTYSIAFAFDQSFSYSKDDREQMVAKLKPMHELGAVGFYYDSHAKFAFGSKSAKAIESLKDHLKDKGLPASRIFEIES